MSSAVRYSKTEVQNRIARDYVMGTLSMAARRRCEKLRSELPDLDRRIYEWAEHLQPMADAVPESAPSPELWSRIESSLNFDSASQRRPTSLLDQIPFLRGLAIATSLATAFLFAVLIAQFNEPAPSELDYIAVLSNDKGDLQFIATASEATKILRIQIRGNTLPEDSDYQLWALSKTDGEARSLGLIAANTEFSKTLDETDWRLIGDAHELLITAEMPGGSPIGEPSDQEISRGLCVRLAAG